MMVELIDKKYVINSKITIFARRKYKSDGI